MPSAAASRSSRPRLWILLLLPAAATLLALTMTARSDELQLQDRAPKPVMQREDLSLNPRQAKSSAEVASRYEADYLCLREFQRTPRDLPLALTGDRRDEGPVGGFSFDVVPLTERPGGSSFRLVVWHPQISSTRSACDAYLHGEHHQSPFSNDGETVENYRRYFHADWFEASLFSLGVDTGSVSSRRLLQPILFFFENHTCTYYSRPLRLGEGGGTVFLTVDHLHEQFRQVRETEEEAHYDYRPMRRLSYRQLPDGLDNTLFGSDRDVGCSIKVDDMRGQAGAHVLDFSSCRVLAPFVEGPCSQALGGWQAQGPDQEEYHSSPRYAGYWLAYKGMPHALHYASKPNLQFDFLGRMNFGIRYTYAQPLWAGKSVATCRARAAGSISALRGCVLNVFRNKRVYFFGDSHVRIFFYGFLSLIGVAYPADKVWRGDRKDVIESHNMTVMYVASYFLNMSRPSALDMLSDRSDGVVIVAGVGQHHSCHCWPVTKHMTVVKDALDTLLETSQRTIVWFGVPAQPYNTHLYRKKPVGQSRKDCRNNARHYLYSLAQRRELERRWGLGSGKGRAALKHVDAFKYSLGMQHTSLDGAHYYGWVRDAWLDDFVSQVESEEGNGE